jgi:hypothetical protein
MAIPIETLTAALSETTPSILHLSTDSSPDFRSDKTLFGSVDGSMTCWRERFIKVDKQKKINTKGQKEQLHYTFCFAH